MDFYSYPSEPYIARRVKAILTWGTFAATLPPMDTEQQPLGLTAEIERALEVVDLDLGESSVPAKPQALKRLSSRHHTLAKCLARGMRNWEAAAITGYAGVTISILKSDPMFQELITAYQEKDELRFEDVQDKLRGAASDALDILSDKINENPEEVSIGQLMEIIKLGADRTGNGPTSTQNTNVNVGIADRLEAARARVLTLRKKDDSYA